MVRSKFIPLMLLLLFGCLAFLLADQSSPAVEATPDDKWEACVDCHEELVAGFAGTIHARIKPHEYATELQGCEACHGDGSKHAEEEDPSLIRGFGNLSAEEASTACLACHSGTSMGHWAGSDHAANDVACTSCHVIHGGSDHEVLAKASHSCQKCHLDVAAEMNLPSHHPVGEGKMSCADCHNAHGSAVDYGLRSSERTNDLCLNCHSSKQGPFIFEHAPVVEDCTICHLPHGSVADNLLTENEPFLCLQCHEFHFHAGTVGNEATSVTLVGEVKPNPYGTYGWKMAYTKKCTQCHVMVHGSDLPSQSVTGQGRGLTR